MTIDSPKFLAPAQGPKQGPAPPVSVLSLSLKTVVNPKSHAHEVVVASVLYHNSVNIDGPTPSKPGQLSRVTAVTSSAHAGISALPVDLNDTIVKEKQQNVIRPMKNEAALLTFLVSRISELDPDVILGHNISGFDLDVLLHRIAQNNVPNWVRAVFLSSCFACPRWGCVH